MTREAFSKARFYRDQLCKVKVRNTKNEYEELGIIKEVNFAACTVKVLIEKWGRSCFVGCELIRFV